MDVDCERVGETPTDHHRDGGDAVELAGVELVEEQWAKQPYHAAEDLEPKEARELVLRGIAEAHRAALRELQGAVQREETRGNRVAVLTNAGGPAILATDALVRSLLHLAIGEAMRW